MDPKLAAIMAKRKQQLDNDEGKGHYPDNSPPRDPQEKQVAAECALPVPGQPAAEARNMGQAAKKETPVLPLLSRSEFLGEALDYSDNGQQAKVAEMGQDPAPDGKVEEAGVGMTLTERYPFTVVSLRDGGSAHKIGLITVGDELLSVDGVPLQGYLSGNEVVQMVIGPVSSMVGLEFRNSEGVVSVKIPRQKQDQDNAAGAAARVDTGETIFADRGSAAAAEKVIIYNDDFDMIDQSEQAIKHQFDPRTREWARTLINVVVQPRCFSEGNLRKAYHMKDLSVAGDDSRYVLKMSKDPNEQTQTYFDDVQMQMEAKMYAQLYNINNPPKKVDFLDAYVLELKDRPDNPICAVEKFIEGDYKKFNNNWSWSDDERNTPQAFSHFTFERSNQQLLVCDIQGVGDTWTDPQFHSHNQEGYGKGNMGKDGIKRFFETHKCNAICGYLKLPLRSGQNPANKGDQGTAVRNNPPDVLTDGRVGGDARFQKGICDVCNCPVFSDQARTKNQRGAYVHMNCAEKMNAMGLGNGRAGGGGARLRDDAALVAQVLLEKEQARQEREELARQKAALESELDAIKAQRRSEWKDEIVQFKTQQQEALQEVQVARAPQGLQPPQSLVAKLLPLGFTHQQVARAHAALGSDADEQTIVAFLVEEEPGARGAVAAQEKERSMMESAVTRLQSMGFTQLQIESAQQACCSESGGLADLKALSEWLLSKILQQQQAEDEASMATIRKLQEEDARTQITRQPNAMNAAMSMKDFHESLHQLGGTPERRGSGGAAVSASPGSCAKTWLCMHGCGTTCEEKSEEPDRCSYKLSDGPRVSGKGLLKAAFKNAAGMFKGKRACCLCERARGWEGFDKHACLQCKAAILREKEWEKERERERQTASAPQTPVLRSSQVRAICVICECENLSVESCAPPPFHTPSILSSFSLSELFSSSLCLPYIQDSEHSYRRF